MFDNIVMKIMENMIYFIHMMEINNCKKCGSKTAYGRKKYKTTNALFMTDKNGLQIKKNFFKKT
ncbi:MAG: hypothetical protein B6I24_02475 [Bacteroidetes bacterium 4572_128]|nr:MAG: hypothetical protein B6I24_02475 [Bacteroidetes bacterium 4572_128]